MGLAVGRDGTLYIADTGNNRIRRVSAEGTITTLAETGAAGFGGDGGQATEALLNSPKGVAVDGEGVVLIADTKNHRIRRVSLDGTVTTYAGTGAPGQTGNRGPASRATLNSPSGVALTAGGVMYVADTGNDAIVNPTLIVEVLSDSTEASDRGEKFAHLQRLSSLKDYVLVSQREQRIEIFRRGSGPAWTFTPFTSGRVELSSVDVVLDMADIYANPLA